MRTLALGLAAAAATLTAGCSTFGGGGGYDSRYADYDYNRPDPRYGRYDADRYYRGGRNYQERTLADNERVYRGRNGRYYCRRNDGTTGLLVGGGVGGLLGNAIAPGGSELLGTVLGAAGGALAGRAVERSRDPVRCR